MARAVHYQNPHNRVLPLCGVYRDGTRRELVRHVELVTCSRCLYAIFKQNYLHRTAEIVWIDWERERARWAKRATETGSASAGTSSPTSMIIDDMHCYAAGCSCKLPKTSATVRAEKWDAWLKRYLEEHKKVRAALDTREEADAYLARLRSTKARVVKVTRYRIKKS